MIQLGTKLGTPPLGAFQFVAVPLRCRFRLPLKLLKAVLQFHDVRLCVLQLQTHGLELRLLPVSVIACALQLYLHHIQLGAALTELAAHPVELGLLGVVVVEKLVMPSLESQRVLVHAGHAVEVLRQRLNLGVLFFELALEQFHLASTRKLPASAVPAASRCRSAPV